MEYGNRVTRSRSRCAHKFSHLNDNFGVESKKMGPSHFQETLAERIFLRRLFSGQQIVQVSSKVFWQWNYIVFIRM